MGPPHGYSTPTPLTLAIGGGLLQPAPEAEPEPQLLWRRRPQRAEGIARVNARDT